MKSILIRSEHDEDIKWLEYLVSRTEGVTCEHLGLYSPIGKGDIKVTCTWGDGPDILVELRGKPVLLLEDPDMSGFLHGVIWDSQIDLTKLEAKQLIERMQLALRHVEELEALSGS